MPQKRNPILCETILTLARLSRTQATTAVDAMMHEHERDWSSFQMEWAYMPELCMMTHAALKILERVVAGLIVYPENMARNLDLTRGSILAERVMLALGKHIGRQQAHDIVYEAAMDSFESRKSFAEVLKCTPTVIAYLTEDTIDSLLDPAQYTGLAAVFVERVVGSTPVAHSG